MPGVILGSGFLKNTRKFEPLFFNSLASVRRLEGSVNPDGFGCSEEFSVANLGGNS